MAGSRSIAPFGLCARHPGPATARIADWPAKEKQQTNIRSATSDNFEQLIPPKKLSLEQCLRFCREDECVEVTPETVRIRKVELDANARAKIASRARKANK